LSQRLTHHLAQIREVTSGNFIKTGLWFPKLTKQSPFIELPQFPYTSITDAVTKSTLIKPSGFGPDGFIKALWGQKKIGQ
jgi:hypothetical protein